MNAPTAPITRIRRLNLENFKGFRGHHPDLDLDADIVLVTGPNGHGKTSLLEAIALLLTGWHDRDADPVTHLISRIPGDGSGKNSRPEDAASLRAEAIFGEGDSTPGEIAWSISATGDDPECKHLLTHTGRPESRLSDPDLEVKLCTFFQDRLPRLFDETGSGNTLRNVFEPRPEWIDWTHTAVVKATDSLKGAADRYENEARPAAEELLSRLNDLVGAFSPHFTRLREGVEGDWPTAPAGCQSEADWTAFVLEILRLTRNREYVPYDPGLPGLFSSVLVGDDGEVAKQIAQARRMARSDAGPAEQNRIDGLQSRLADIAAEQGNIVRRYPRLEQDLIRFAATADGLPDALAIFRTLAVDASRWAQNPRDDDARDNRFMQVVEQLKAVVPEDAGKCAEALEAWLVPRREARHRLVELAREVERIEAEIESLRSRAEVLNLEQLKRDLAGALDELNKTWIEIRKRLDFERRAEQRRQACTFLEQARNAVVALDGWLEDLTRPNSEIMKRLADVGGFAMRRFSTVPGLLPLRLEQKERVPDRLRIYQVLAGDGRELVQLSTGQRAQFGVALLVAQNREVSEYLSHRLLLLDDVSTSYDLSNLTREALLWRQLAYGAKPPFRRQIFISSHHEDMTNHLLDLLVPPGRASTDERTRSLRLIRFTDWSPETGPVIESFAVEPTAAADGPEVQGFVRSIQEERYLWQTV